MESVFKYLNDLLCDDDYVVVGVSGGPDSMALLHVLSQFNCHVICAHVNHLMRPESEAEALFVKNYCYLNNIVFEESVINNYTDINFHQEARDFRYDFFMSLVNKYGAKYLMTAHHGDDLIETILMRIVRGSSLKGYGGFSRVYQRGDCLIVKPFITVTKENILNYNKEHEIKFVNDLSNLKDVYTRNRYRLKVIPFLKLEDKNVVSKFYQFSEKLLACNDYVMGVALSLLDLCYNDYLDIDILKKNDCFLQDKIIFLLLAKVYGNNISLVSSVHVSLIMDLINSSKVNAFIYLPDGVKAVKSYNRLNFDRKDIVNDNYEFEFSLFVNLPNGRNIKVVDEALDDDNFVCRLNKNCLPLIVRNRFDGLKMEVKGLNGHKKVNDIFIDAKISLWERNIFPIVMDRHGNVVWLPGLKKSKFCKTKNEKYDIILRYY
ncbi:MAG: tRNA lysidine(34) synthetase TilS [Bacilli bacterium]